MKNSKTIKIIYSLTPIFSVCLFVAIWFIAALSVNIPLILPTPSEVFLSLADVLFSGGFYAALFNTVMRALVGFVIALALALLLAVLSSKIRIIEMAFYPIVVFVRAAPTMSVIFLCLIWFKAAISPIIVSFTVIFPMLYSSALSALKSVDSSLIEMSLIYNVSKTDRLFKLYLPSVSSRVFSDAVNALSLNVKLTVAAEALAQTALSLGRLMQAAKINLETASLFAYTLAAIIVSYLLELCLRLIRAAFIAIKKRRAAASVEKMLSREANK